VVGHTDLPAGIGVGAGAGGRVCGEEWCGADAGTAGLAVGSVGGVLRGGCQQLGAGEREETGVWEKWWK